MDKHLSLSSLIVLTPRRAGLLAGQDNTVEVLVRIQAPDAPVGHTAVRPPQAIALVIDRSGSMEGRPLAEARALCRIRGRQVAADGRRVAGAVRQPSPAPVARRAAG